MARTSELVRHLLNLANLSTPLGLAVARFGRCDIQPGPDHLILAENYRFRFPAAGAFTIGNVVITPHRWDALLARTPRLLHHEARHATQWAACWGLPFLPAYLIAMGWSWLRTDDRASHNVFEVAAGLTSGGYRRRPLRWSGRFRGDGPSGPADARTADDVAA